MNKEVKARWLAALRSGEFEQGRGVLEKNGKFCCLGVLCKVEGLKRRVSKLGVVEYSFDGEIWVYVTTPNSFEDKIELPLLITDALASANDRGDSFAWIADWIEANL